MILVYKDVKKSVLRTETTTSPIPGSEGVPILTILIPGTRPEKFLREEKVAAVSFAQTVCNNETGWQV